MGAIAKLFKSTGAVIVFMIGLIVMMYESRTYLQTLEIVRNQQKEEVLYQQYYSADKEIVSYAELVAILLRPLEYDIRINKALISKETHQPDLITDYNIEIGDYKKNYEYDAGGDLVRIIYTSIIDTGK